MFVLWRGLCKNPCCLNSPVKCFLNCPPLREETTELGVSKIWEFKPVMNELTGVSPVYIYPGVLLEWALKPLAQVSEAVFDGYGSSLVKPQTAGCKADGFSFRSRSKFPYLCGGHSLLHKDFVGTESFIYFVKKKI